MARCRVSFTDSEQTEYAVEVEAESLYEAVALAVADFREDPLLPGQRIFGGIVTFTANLGPSSA
jgi:hypothetical protein